jgi:hypothetical protein
MDQILLTFIKNGTGDKVIKGIANRFRITESDAGLIANQPAEQLDDTFIFESAPLPKGTTMGTRTTASLSSAEAGQIKRIFQKNGTTPTVIAGVRQQYNLTEATAEAFAMVVNEAAGKPTSRTVTEAAPPPGVSHAVYEAAAAMDGGGVPDMTGLSVGDLQSLAGAVYGPLAFRD